MTGSGGLCGAVAAQLTDLSAPGQPLHANCDRRTAVLYAGDTDRASLHKDVIAKYLSRASPMQDGRSAIVTAGPPAAGKSTALHAEIVGLDTYRILDVSDPGRRYRQGVPHRTGTRRRDLRRSSCSRARRRTPNRARRALGPRTRRIGATHRANPRDLCPPKGEHRRRSNAAVGPPWTHNFLPASGRRLRLRSNIGSRGRPRPRLRASVRPLVDTSRRVDCRQAPTRRAFRTSGGNRQMPSTHWSFILRAARPRLDRTREGRRNRKRSSNPVPAHRRWVSRNARRRAGSLLGRC